MEIHTTLVRIWQLKEAKAKIESQIKELSNGLPNPSLTGDKIIVPAHSSHPELKCWMQCSKTLKLDQVMMHEAFLVAEKESTTEAFKVTITAPDIEKIKKGKIEMSSEAAALIKAAVSYTESAPFWMIKAATPEGEPDQE